MAALLERDVEADRPVPARRTLPADLEGGDPPGEDPRPPACIPVELGSMKPDGESSSRKADRLPLGVEVAEDSVDVAVRGRRVDAVVPRREARSSSAATSSGRRPRPEDHDAQGASSLM